MYCVFVLASHATAGSGSTQDREGHIIFVQWLGGHMLPFAKWCHVIDESKMIQEAMLSMFAVPMTKSQYQQWNPSITDTIGNQHGLTSFPGLARSSLAARKIRAEFRAASDEHLTASLGVPGRRGLRKLSHAVRWQGRCLLFWDCLNCPTSWHS